MLAMVISIMVLLTLVIAGCVSTSAATPPLTTPTPKCRNNACVRAVMVTTANGALFVRFVLTDQNGNVDATNPPRLGADNLSFEISLLDSNGTEKSIFNEQRSGQDIDCFASDRFQEFDGQHIGVCGFIVPAAAGATSVQVGDKLKISLKEFEFEQVVTVREQTIGNAPAQNNTGSNAASITDAFFMLPDGSSAKSLAFPKDQPILRVIVVVANVAADTKLKLALTAVDIGDVAPANSVDFHCVVTFVRDLANWKIQGRYLLGRQIRSHFGV
ncbi:MAG TPA: hypothetical protein VMP08_01280 [Anaerolineae bacterium]|nr:hypothetical protein [Anaerolineae bacterium]